MSVRYWYVVYCPCKDNKWCATGNFIAGDSPQQAKEYLRHHLEDRCFHDFTENEIKEFVEEAQVDSYQYDPEATAKSKIESYQYDPEATAKRKREDGEPQRSERDGGAKRSRSEDDMLGMDAAESAAWSKEAAALKEEAWKLQQATWKRLKEAAQQCSKITDALHRAAKATATLEWNLRYLANSFRIDDDPPA